MAEEHALGEVFPHSLDTLKFLLPGDLPTAFHAKKSAADNREHVLRLLAEALDAASDGVLIFDSSKSNLVIQYINTGFERLTGYKRKEALNNSFNIMQGPHTNPETQQKLHIAIEHKKSIYLELLYHRRDGAPFWCSVSLIPVLNTDIENGYFVAILRDVSHRIHSEEQLYETMRLLESANLELTHKNSLMHQNLTQAAKVQRALLPTMLPETDRIKFKWLFEPSEELAGDILNVFWLDKYHIGVYLLDVTGHGTASALLAVAVSRMLQPTTSSASLVWSQGQDRMSFNVVPPAEVANQLNDYFPWDPEGGQFFTLVYGILNVSTLEFRYVCAGHPSPLYITPQGNIEWSSGGGVPIGLSRKPYQEQSMQLQPGGRVLFYSDGITDVMDSNRQTWGQIRLCKTMRTNTTLDLSECLNDVMQRTSYWSDNEEIKDDRTMVGLDILRTGKQDSLSSSNFGVHI